MYVLKYGIWDWLVVHALLQGTNQKEIPGYQAIISVESAECTEEYNAETAENGMNFLFYCVTYLPFLSA
jgi:hypothetical protein